MKKQLQEKVWYKSKTLWVNVLAILGGIVLGVSDQLALGGALTLAGVVNIGLRVVTKHQLKK